MYLYRVNPGSCTASGTAFTWLPFLSVKPGNKPIRIRDLRIASSSEVWALVVKYTSANTSGGSAVTANALSVDNPTAALAGIGSTSGGLTPGKGGPVQGYLLGIIPNTASEITELLNADALQIAANGLGSIDVYVASPTASATFTPTLVVEE